MDLEQGVGGGGEATNLASLAHLRSRLLADGEELGNQPPASYR